MNWAEVAYVIERERKDKKRDAPPKRSKGVVVVAEAVVFVERKDMSSSLSLLQGREARSRGREIQRERRSNPRDGFLFCFVL
jgi:hypothetical protein